MKRLAFVCTISLLLGVFASCKKDFLNVTDKSEIIREEYVKNIKTTNEYLNGIYVVLGKDFYRADFQIYPELVADNIKPVAAGFTLIPHYRWGQVIQEYNNMNVTWQTGYQLARSCSFAIEKAEQYRNQDTALANSITAQAHAIRGLVHFMLVNIFAQSYNFTANAAHPGVPFISSSNWKQPVIRNTVADVYAKVIADLQTALALYRSDFTDVLAMNVLSTKALLARVCLYKTDYVQAKKLSEEVLAAVPIMTGSDYPSRLFTLQETEALFQLPPSSPQVVSGSYSTGFQGQYFSGNEYMVQFLATDDIASLLRENPNDVRNAWISSGGPGMDTIVKYPRDVVPGFSLESQSYYATIIRSSEMVLTAAEASAKMNQEDDARQYLDQIRLRADPGVAPITSSGAELLDSINSERRKEMCFEGLRMFDLLRWKKSVNRSDALTPDVGTLSYPNNKAIAPIPMIDVQNAGIPQNPGY